LAVHRSCLWALSLEERVKVQWDVVDLHTDVLRMHRVDEPLSGATELFGINLDGVQVKHRVDVVFDLWGLNAGNVCKYRVVAGDDFVTASFESRDAVQLYATETA
jgi:hypothetical protein